MTRHSIQKQTTRHTPSHEARIRKALLRFEAKRKAAATEAARVRDLLARTVEGLSEASLRALSARVGELSWGCILEPISDARDLLRSRLPKPPRPAPILEYPPAIARQLAQAAPRLLALVEELKVLRATRFHGLVSELDGEVDDLYAQIQDQPGPAVSELCSLSLDLGSLLEGMDELETAVAKVLRRVAPSERDEWLRHQLEELRPGDPGPAA